MDPLALFFHVNANPHKPLQGTLRSRGIQHTTQLTWLPTLSVRVMCRYVHTRNAPSILSANRVRETIRVCVLDTIRMFADNPASSGAMDFSCRSIMVRKELCMLRVDRSDRSADASTFCITSETASCSTTWVQCTSCQMHLKTYIVNCGRDPIEQWFEHCSPSLVGPS